jgi:hypothetical protein
MQQTPRHIYTTHFTARRFYPAAGGGTVEISPASLLESIKQSFFVASSSLEGGDAAELVVAWEKHVIFAASFFWGESIAAESAAAPTTAVLEQKLGEMKDKNFSLSVFEAASSGADGGDNGDDDSSSSVTVIEAQTLFYELNDNRYAQETERVFRAAMRACGRTDTMPIIAPKKA